MTTASVYILHSYISLEPPMRPGMAEVFPRAVFSEFIRQIASGHDVRPLEMPYFVATMYLYTDIEGPRNSVPRWRTRNIHLPVPTAAAQFYKKTSHAALPNFNNFHTTFLYILSRSLYFTLSFHSFDIPEKVLIEKLRTSVAQFWALRRGLVLGYSCRILIMHYPGACIQSDNGKLKAQRGY